MRRLYVPNAEVTETKNEKVFVTNSISTTFENEDYLCGCSDCTDNESDCLRDCDREDYECIGCKEDRLDKKETEYYSAMMAGRL